MNALCPAYAGELDDHSGGGGGGGASSEHQEEGGIEDIVSRAERLDPSKPITDRIYSLNVAPRTFGMVTAHKSVLNTTLAKFVDGPPGSRGGGDDDDDYDGEGAVPFEDDDDAADGGGKRQRKGGLCHPKGSGGGSVNGSGVGAFNSHCGHAGMSTPHTSSRAPGDAPASTGGHSRFAAASMKEVGAERAVALVKSGRVVYNPLRPSGSQTPIGRPVHPDDIAPPLPTGLSAWLPASVRAFVSFANGEERTRAPRDSYTATTTKAKKAGAAPKRKKGGVIGGEPADDSGKSAASPSGSATSASLMGYRDKSTLSRLFADMHGNNARGHLHMHTSSDSDTTFVGGSSPGFYSGGGGGGRGSDEEDVERGDSHARWQTTGTQQQKRNPLAEAMAASSSKPAAAATAAAASSGSGSHLHHRAVAATSTSAVTARTIPYFAIAELAEDDPTPATTATAAVAGRGDTAAMASVAGRGDAALDDAGVVLNRNSRVSSEASHASSASAADAAAAAAAASSQQQHRHDRSAIMNRARRTESVASNTSTGAGGGAPVASFTSTSIAGGGAATVVTAPAAAVAAPTAAAAAGTGSVHLLLPPPPSTAPAPTYLPSLQTPSAFSSSAALTPPASGVGISGSSGGAAPHFTPHKPAGPQPGREQQQQQQFSSIPAPHFPPPNFNLVAPGVESLGPVTNFNLVGPVTLPAMQYMQQPGLAMPAQQQQQSAYQPSHISLHPHLPPAPHMPALPGHVVASPSAGLAYLPPPPHLPPAPTATLSQRTQQQQEDVRAAASRALQQQLQKQQQQANPLPHHTPSGSSGGGGDPYSRNSTDDVRSRANSVAAASATTAASTRVRIAGGAGSALQAAAAVSNAIPDAFDGAGGGHGKAKSHHASFFGSSGKTSKAPITNAPSGTPSAAATDAGAESLQLIREQQQAMHDERAARMARATGKR